MSPRIAVQRLRRGRRSGEVDALRLSQTVVPIPGASMRLLEVTIAIAAFAVAILLGVTH